MNADERQAIRAHHVAIVAYCQCCEFICRECSAAYPCDAIRLLDATEPAGTEIRASGNSDAMPVNECDHPDVGFYSFCPICGEELKNKPNCKHILARETTKRDCFGQVTETSVIVFTYCPKCGEKL